MVTPKHKDEIRHAMRESIDRAVAWLLAQQSPDGSFKPVEAGLYCYYKSPMALACRGEVEAGVRLTSWITTNALIETGDLNGRYGRGAMAVNATYPNAWVTWGAHRLGMFELSLPTIQHILTLQDTDTGGFYRVLPDTQPEETPSAAGTYGSGVVPGGQDLLCASMAGIACLTTGHVDRAVRAGDFLDWMFAAQPTPAERVYTQARGHELITEFPADQAIAFAIDSRETGQNYFQVGIAAAFLARLYQATGTNRYLDLAQAYLDLTNHFAPDRYSIGKAGKIGWGAAYVYRLTGNERYLSMSIAVIEALIGLQGPSGSWVESAPQATRVEVTSEFITLLSEMQEVLA